jgi:hypothetical protein
MLSSPWSPTSMLEGPQEVEVTIDAGLQPEHPLVTPPACRSEATQCNAVTENMGVQTEDPRVVAPDEFLT